jgi:antitoxin CptB
MKSDLAWDNIKWKSRRGMKELDLMLEPYVNDYLPAATDCEFDEYNDFLNLTDLELVRFLLRRQQPQDPLVIKVVNSILSYHEKLLGENK